MLHEVPVLLDAVMQSAVAVHPALIPAWEAAAELLNMMGMKISAGSRGWAEARLTLFCGSYPCTALCFPL